MKIFATKNMSLICFWKKKPISTLFTEQENIFLVIFSLKNSVTPGFRDFSFLLSNTFVYEQILLKLSVNANIVKLQIFHKIKYVLRDHSRSQIMTFLIKNLLFLLFKLLIN